MRCGMVLIAVVMVVAGLAAPPLPAAGQETPSAQRIEITGDDGLMRVGLFYLPDEVSGSTPLSTAFLIHGRGGQKENWDGYLAPFLERGYAVLTVDLRGYGETDGRVEDWQGAIDDMQLWLDWLRAQEGIDPDGISLIGVSMGTMVALWGMANDPRVATAVAISPIFTYRELDSGQAVQIIGKRPLYLVSGRIDLLSADAARRLAALSQGELYVRLYNNGSHATGLLDASPDLMPSILDWLDEHSR